MSGQFNETGLNSTSSTARSKVVLDWAIHHYYMPRCKRITPQTSCSVLGKRRFLQCCFAESYALLSSGLAVQAAIVHTL